MSDDPAPVAVGGDVVGDAIRVGSMEFSWRPGVVITVGRDTACDVVVDDPRVSRAHLRIEAVGGRSWQLSDAGSLNGVFVSGRRIDAQPVRGPVQLRMGASDGVLLAVSVTRPAADARPPAAQASPPAAPTGPVMAVPPGGLSDAEERNLGRHVSVYVPDREVVRIGRDPSNELVIREDPRASRRHAELRHLADGRWEVRDLDSANGTFVNGGRTSRAVLSDGDLLTVGNHLFVFRGGQLEQLSEADDTSLDAIGLSVTAHGGATLLQEVSFSLPSRSVLAVVGPSGVAGKTTLLRALTGSLTPSQGQVCFARVRSAQCLRGVPVQDRLGAAGRPGPSGAHPAE